MFARFNENPVMTLQDTKETKRYGRTHNVKTVYPPQTKFAGGKQSLLGGGYNYINKLSRLYRVQTITNREPSGSVLDSRPRGCGFEPHRHHCVVSLSKTQYNPSLVLVQLRKTYPYITERLLMGRNESNQTKK